MLRCQVDEPDWIMDMEYIHTHAVGAASSLHAPDSTSNHRQAKDILIQQYSINLCVKIPRLGSQIAVVSWR